MRYAPPRCSVARLLRKSLSWGQVFVTWGREACSEQARIQSSCRRSRASSSGSFVSHHHETPNSNSSIVRPRHGEKSIGKINSRGGSHPYILVDALQRWSLCRGLIKPRLVKRVSTARGKKVDFHTHTKPSDIGGFRGGGRFGNMGPERCGSSLRVEFASCGQEWHILIGASLGGL